MASRLIRIKYSKLGKIRFLGHRDLARVWERVLRRSRLPLEYTQGFSPHPRMAFGLALPVGWESTAEYLEVRFSGEVRQGELEANLESLLPQGLEILASGPVQKEEKRSLSDLAEVADYLVVVEARHLREERRDASESAVFEPELWLSLDELLEKDEVLATVKRRGTEIVEDIRPMIVGIGRFQTRRDIPESLGVLQGAPRVFMRLRTKPYVLRPDVVLQALTGEISWSPRLVRRTAQYWQGEGGLVSIDKSIEPWDSAS